MVQSEKNLTALYDRIIAAIGAIKRSRIPSGSYLNSKIGLWCKKKDEGREKIRQGETKRKIFVLYPPRNFIFAH